MLRLKSGTTPTIWAVFGKLYLHLFQKSQSIVSLTAKRTNWLLTNLMNILLQLAKIRSIKSSHWLTNAITILRNRLLSQSAIRHLNSLHSGLRNAAKLNKWFKWFNGNRESSWERQNFTACTVSKDCLPAILPTLTSIVSNSLTSGVFPCGRLQKWSPFINRAIMKNLKTTVPYLYCPFYQRYARKLHSINLCLTWC